MIALEGWRTTGISREDSSNCMEGWTTGISREDPSTAWEEN